MFGFIDLELSGEIVFDNVGLSVRLEEERISLYVLDVVWERFSLYELELNLLVLDFDLYLESINDGSWEMWNSI